MKKVILLTKHFPPMPEIGGKRADKVCKGFFENDFLPTVFTLEPNSTLGKINESHFRVKYVCTHDPISGIKLFNNNNDKKYFVKQKNSNIYKGIKRRVEKYVWPIFYLLKFYLKVGKFLKDNRADYLFATSPPAWIYYAALLLKFKNPKLKLVIDFRDPWFHEESNEFWGIQKKINSFFFKKTIHHADIITATTQSCLDLVEKFFTPQNRANLQFIYLPNGVDLNLFSDIPTQKISSINRLTFGHLGDLDYVNRNPIPFLSAFNNFINEDDNNQLEMHFWGKMRVSWNGRTIGNHLASLDNDENIILHDPVSHVEALSITTGLDVLVLFALGQMFQIPAKTYEYLLSDKLILAFCERKSETCKALENFEGVFICESNDLGSIKKSLGDIVTYLKCNKETSRRDNYHRIDFFYNFDKFIREIETIEQ